ncbi:MAG: folate family ECF transporter S component [Clostridia bacterium]|nr:folate family ECF transporter S component [Clostridia bacterium]
MLKKQNIIIAVCVSAVMVSLEIVLNRFCSINTMGLKIGFAFIPPTFAAILLGPAWGAAVYAVSDLLGALLFPIGPYHPGFTVCAALMGVCAGLFLSSNPVNAGRISFFCNILPCVLINCIVIGLFINTAWVSMLYGKKTYFGWFLYRLSEYAVLIPVQLIIIPILIGIAGRLKKSGLLPGGFKEENDI